MTPPLCITSRDLARCDGQRVRLLGIYRKRKTEKPSVGPVKMRRARPTDLGYYGIAELEMLGDHKDYRPDNWASATPCVSLGQRPDDEYEACADQLVVIEGVLDVDPYREVREAKPTYATVVWGPPVLRETGAARLATPEERASHRRKR